MKSYFERDSNILLSPNLRRFLRIPPFLAAVRLASHAITLCCVKSDGGRSHNRSRWRETRLGRDGPNNTSRLCLDVSDCLTRAINMTTVCRWAVNWEFIHEKVNKKRLKTVLSPYLKTLQSTPWDLKPWRHRFLGFLHSVFRLVNPFHKLLVLVPKLFAQQQSLFRLSSLRWHGTSDIWPAVFKTLLSPLQALTVLFRGACHAVAAKSLPKS